ncbi:MAG: PH domain-containing protein [Planctomycetales bacterium]|nr:PH domain-containing protein [Planctomycetales bacterium]
MKQAIAGVTPATEKEVTCMTVWPSVAGMSLGPIPVGRILGQLYSIPAGIYPLTIGNLLCLATIPIAILLYARRIGPFVATRYRVTNKRIVVERGITGKEERSIDLNKFDSVGIRVLPGQEWFDAGDLVFTQGNVEKFILEGVSRPEAFRRVCLKAHQAYSGVQEAMAAFA